MRRWQANRSFFMSDIINHLKPDSDFEKIARVKQGDFIYESVNAERIVVNGRSVLGDFSTGGWKGYCTYIGDIAENEIGDTGTGSGGADGAAGYLYQYTAQALESPFDADWAVNSNAAISADASNAGIVVRLFGDSAESGAGTQSVVVPDNVTDMIISLHWRAVTAPGGTVGCVWKLYHRSENNTVSAWSNQVLNTASISNAEWKSTSQTISLSTLGITAGDKRQFEITRVPTEAEDTLAGNAALESIVLEFV